jgi:glycosyltransferase involved in cell wall biosynthesis
MAKPRVLFIVHALRHAGAETQLVALVNGLPADQFEKFILSYRSGDGLKNDVNIGEVKAFELRRKRRLDIGVLREIGRIIDEHAIDVVHCTMRHAMLFGYLGIRFSKRKPKLIAAIHSTKNASLKLDVVGLLVYRSILRKCGQVWFVSTRQAESWIRKMPFLTSKAITIHNGVDLDEFEPKRFQADSLALKESLGIRENENIICSIAGFRSEKLHSVLIEAFSRVRAEGYACRLLLAGAGPLERALRKQVSTLGLDGSVKFLGLLSDVRAVLAASDCMLLVSKAETFSMAMLEAMAMEVPVITTSVGGAAEAIEDGISGFLVKPRDVSELAEKIKALLDDDIRRLRMGRASREVVVENFSSSNMIEKSARSLLAAAVEN